ncbi:MAG: DUF192 domain-containing protein [Proteobacteria bacterium]|nr:DUF192 domain-containing protein [Pseudomonadota bacterium]
MKQGQFHISSGSQRHQFFILLFSLSCAILFGCRDPQQPHVCINDHCFQVELAVTPDARARGLMFRKHLDKDRGMLFIFEEEDIHPFWMKNTLLLSSQARKQNMFWSCREAFQIPSGSQKEIRFLLICVR